MLGKPSHAEQIYQITLALSILRGPPSGPELTKKTSGIFDCVYPPRDSLCRLKEGLYWLLFVLSNGAFDILMDRTEGLPLSPVPTAVIGHFDPVPLPGGLGLGILRFLGLPKGDNE